MNIVVRNIWVVLFVMLYGYGNLALAETRSGLSGTIKVLGVGWQGENKNNGTSFVASEGKQWSVSVNYLYGDFYTGLNIQGGVYTFGNPGPDQMSAAPSVAVTNVEVAHSEVDLVAGFFINPQFSVFLDIKGISNIWENYHYEQSFGGLGLGATGMWPLQDDWLLYGTIGFVSKGNLRVNNTLVGKGNTGSFDIGAMYTLDKGQRLIFGLKLSSETFNFDSGDQQIHEFSGIFFGYSHAFFFDEN